MSLHAEKNTVIISETIAVHELNISRYPYRTTTTQYEVQHTSTQYEVQHYSSNVTCICLELAVVMCLFQVEL